MEATIVTAFQFLATLVLSAVAALALARLIKWYRTLSPIEVKAERSPALPAWYATKDVPTEETLADGSFEKSVKDGGLFCGFARYAVAVTNKSSEMVYITDMHVRRKRFEVQAPARVRFIPQGAVSPVRLRCLLDDDPPVMTDDLLSLAEGASGFFEAQKRIQIAPGETERFILGFVTLEHAWLFNVDFVFEAGGKSRNYDRALGADATIVAYKPRDSNMQGAMEHDYTPFLMRIDPDAHKEFEDARFFTSDMLAGGKSGVRGERTEPASTLDYLQRMLH